MPDDTNSTLVWSSFAPFDERFERSAAMLVAARNRLALDRPLRGGEGEFLELYEAAAALDPDSFTTVWTAPGISAWVDEAFVLLGDCLAVTRTGSGEAASDAAARLATHLDYFKAIAVAQHVIAGRDRRLRRPYPMALPFALPGTRYVVEGKGAADLVGVEAAALIVAHDDDVRTLPLAAAGSAEPSPVRLRLAPVATEGGCLIQLNPHALQVPGLDFAEARAALVGGLDYQFANRGLVDESLRLMQRHAPEVFGQFREVMRCISLKDPLQSDFQAASSSDALGAFVASAVANPHRTADGFIHEFHHNRLFFIEENEPLFIDGAASDTVDGQHYSPWRDDLRPFRGIMHALYVFVPVCRFWLRVLLAGASDDLAALAFDRVRRISLQIDIAIDVLDRVGQFTSHGRGFFEEVRLTVRALQADVAASRLPADGPAYTRDPDSKITPQLSATDGRPLSVRRAVAEHIERFDLKREAASWLPVLRSAA